METLMWTPTRLLPAMLVAATVAATSACAGPVYSYRGGYAPLPSGIHIAPYAYCYRCPVARAAGKATDAISQAAPRDAGCCGEPLHELRHMLQTETVAQKLKSLPTIACASSDCR